MSLPYSSYLQKHNGEICVSLLGTLTVLGGLVTAIVLIPDDPRPTGAMFWPALSLVLGLLAVPILLMRASVSSILRSEHMLMIALVYWLLLDMLQSAYPLELVTYDSVVMAIIAIGTMAIGIWIGTLGKGWHPPKLIIRAAQLSLNDSMLFLAVWITFFLGMFHIAWSSGFDPSVMIDGLFGVRFAAPWDRGALGDWNAFSEHMIYFGYVLPSLTVLLAHQRGWVQPRVVISATLSLIMVLFLMQFGGRRIIGVVIGAALVVWLLLQKQLRPKVVIGALLGLAILLTVMQEMVLFRKVGFEGWLRGESPEMISHLHVDDNFLRLSQTTALFPNIAPYAGIEPLVYVLARPIPRVFWAEKPVDPGYDISTLINLQGSIGTALTHSIVGELYTMYGLGAVFLGGLFFGRLACMWNKVLDVSGGNKILVYGLGTMIIFVSIRSMQDLVIMSYALFGWIVVARMLHSRKTNRSVPVQSYTALPPHRLDSQCRGSPVELLPRAKSGIARS
jgi:hypothetical protein